MTSIMTTDAEVLAKLGTQIDTNFTDAMKTAAGLQAESILNCLCIYDFSAAATAGLDSATKGILSDFVSSFVARQGIRWNMGAYTTRFEAEDMILDLDDSMKLDIQLLRNKSVQKFITDKTTGTV